ncbi:hypothetical protein LVD17_18660 [Fulvivirga ulvae]|uniref:hypothetical protein n=1 Tax=Fulvivirga ulvae TaxID=2904245 RepID=UPI001F2F658F|nr:hypothetical protein [Fulvivirga ulvae]UII30318.1 hypothetical protein LVD17_18660 [Fulvivirga ulvae]
MSDQFEKFIRDNRHEFDNDEPTNRVWESVYKKLGSAAGRQYNWLWKAASILFFITSSVMFYQLNYGSDDRPIAFNKEKVNDEFLSVESFYFQKISEKKELIYDFEESNIKVDEAFEQDLQKLDAMYEVLKDELKNNPSKKVVDALILNLLVRVDILNKELQELEDYASKNKKEEDGTEEINV